MKTACFALVLALAPAGMASAEAPAKAAPCPSCDKGASRLAALTAAADCPEDCTKPCCSGETAVFAVTGMDQDGLAARVEAALAKTDGAKVEKVCQTSGVAAVKYDPAKTTPAALAQVITATGATVAGQEMSFKVAGMTCSGCSAKLTKVLAGTEGVAQVKSVSHETGEATVLINPAKTDHAKLTAVINKSGYKVQEG
jgi:copper chaperone CopZ